MSPALDAKPVNILELLEALATAHRHRAEAQAVVKAATVTGVLTVAMVAAAEMERQAVEEAVLDLLKAAGEARQ